MYCKILHFILSRFQKLFFFSCGVVPKFKLSFVFTMRLQSFSIKHVLYFFLTTAVRADENDLLNVATGSHSIGVPSMWALSRSPCCNLRWTYSYPHPPPNPTPTCTAPPRRALSYSQLGSLGQACFHTWQRNGSRIFAARCLPLTCRAALHGAFFARQRRAGAKPAAQTSRLHALRLTFTLQPVPPL